MRHRSPALQRTFLAALTLATVTLSVVRCSRPPAAGSEPRRVAAQVSWKDLLGCWALYDSAGRRAEASLYWAPPFVQLDSSLPRNPRHRGPGRQAHKLDSLHRRIETSRSLEGSIWWTDSLVDTVQMVFSNGFSGTRFKLGVPKRRRVPDTLRGRAIEFWDEGPTMTLAGSASAVRVSCEP